jgi:hypothetical protein
MQISKYADVKIGKFRIYSNVKANFFSKFHRDKINDRAVDLLAPLLFTGNASLVLVFSDNTLHLVFLYFFRGLSLHKSPDEKNYKNSLQTIKIVLPLLNYKNSLLCRSKN